MKLSAAGLLFIKNKKLLLAFSKNKQCFYLPGGKVDSLETSRQALCREIAEELGVEIAETDLTFYAHITAPAYGETEGIMMEQDCFLLQRTIEPKAAAEIAELRYFSLAEYMDQPTTAPGAIMILQLLTENGLIDK